MEVVRSERLSVHDLFFRKPNWVSGRRRLCSSHHASLLFRSLSRSLRRDWAREMGLNLSVFPFEMKKTRNSFQDLGKTSF